MLEKWRELKNKVLSGGGKTRKADPAVSGGPATKIVVSDVMPEMGVTSGELVRIASGLTMDSECDDLAAALLGHSTDMLVAPVSFESVEYIPQQVFLGEDETGNFAFGYADYFHSQGIEIPSSMLAQLKLFYQDEKETFLVARNNEIIGLIALRTQPYGDIRS